LQSLDDTTNDNGKQLTVRGEREGDVLSVHSERASIDRTGCVSSYAYWNSKRLLEQGELLNPQTGEIDKVKVEMMGEESLVVGGRESIANRIRIRRNSGDIDLWYSKEGEWLQLESITEQQRRIRYRVR
jgi:Family of unknown function (DUF6134)